MEPEDEQKAETTQIAGNAGPIKAVLIQRHRNALQALRQQLLRHFKELRIRRCCNRWICLLISLLFLIGLVLFIVFAKVVYEDLPSEQCPSEWIGYRKKCYFISEEEQNWTASQTFCAKNRSVLAVFENQEEMVKRLLFWLVGTCFSGVADSEMEKISVKLHTLKMEDSWIGLRKKGESFCWENDIALEVDLFQIQNHSECAYLESFTISTSACSLPRRWICVRSSLK